MCVCIEAIVPHFSELGEGGLKLNKSHFWNQQKKNEVRLDFGQVLVSNCEMHAAPCPQTLPAMVVV